MNETTNPVESELILNNYYIDECTYMRKEQPRLLQGALEIEYNFNRTITRVDDENYIVSLRANIFSKDGSVEVHTRAVGEFSVKCEDSRQKNVLISKNTVAILLPFVRSQIILVTSQTGLLPIALPLVNIAAMFEDTPLPGEAGS